MKTLALGEFEPTTATDGPVRIRTTALSYVSRLTDAETFRDVSKREIKKVPALRGRTVINLFFEPSTRTRTSFEIAAKHGAQYRAGVNFVDADGNAVGAFCVRHKQS